MKISVKANHFLPSTSSASTNRRAQRITHPPEDRSSPLHYFPQPAYSRERPFTSAQELCTLAERILVHQFNKHLGIGHWRRRLLKTGDSNRKKPDEAKCPKIHQNPRGFYEHILRTCATCEFLHYNLTSQKTTRKQ